MLNTYSFEGNLISVIPDDKTGGTWLKLEGLSPSGQVVVMSFSCSKEVSKAFERLNKYVRVGVEGHFEMFSKDSGNGNIKRRIIHICDKVLWMKDSKVDYDN